MKKRTLAILAGIILFYTASWGQAGSNLYIETGLDGLGCASPEKPYIRAVNSVYWEGYHAQSIWSMAGLPHFTLKYEKMLSGNVLGLSSGLRYSQLMGYIGRENLFSGEGKFFYVNYNETGQTTEYARVTGLSQRSGYLGVPVELRVTPGKDRVVKVFFRAGLSFNVLLHSATEIDFFDNQMNSYSNEVNAIIEEPSPFYGSFSLGGGLKLGRNDRTGVLLGVNLLTAVVTGRDKGLVRPIAGAGGQIMVRIPLNYQEQ